MRKIIEHLLGLAAVILLLPGLQSCDNRQDELTELGARVDNLEKKAEAYNQEVNALYAIAQSYYNKAEWITGITKESDGWRITFKSNPSLLVRDGQDGADGKVPQLSIKKDEGGRLYWELDGSPMMYGGSIVYAEALDGQEAALPSFRINEESGEWELKYGDGVWESTGVVAQGEEGDAGAAGVDRTIYIFKSVKVDEAAGLATFILRDGTEFIVPLSPKAL